MFLYVNKNTLEQIYSLFKNKTFFKMSNLIKLNKVIHLQLFITDKIFHL